MALFLHLWWASCLLDPSVWRFGGLACNVAVEDGLGSPPSGPQVMNSKPRGFWGAFLGILQIFLSGILHVVPFRVLAVAPFRVLAMALHSGCRLWLHAGCRLWLSIQGAGHGSPFRVQTVAPFRVLLWLSSGCWLFRLKSLDSQIQKCS